MGRSTVSATGGYLHPRGFHSLGRLYVKSTGYVPVRQRTWAHVGDGDLPGMRWVEGRGAPVGFPTLAHCLQMGGMVCTHFICSTDAHREDALNVVHLEARL
jgi:hypothetical protein